MIKRWFHNKRYKNEPKCICGWRMIPSTKQHFENYWKCLCKNCTWEAFTTTSYRIRFWKS